MSKEHRDPNEKHRRPCGECAFRRSCPPGETGGSPAYVYVVQTLMPYWIPCHEFTDYDDPNWKTDHTKPQCVGHSIMRDKMNVLDVMPEPLLHITSEDVPDNDVFNSLFEFYAHHEQITVEEAKDYLTPARVEDMCRFEFNKASNNIQTTDEMYDSIEGQ